LPSKTRVSVAEPEFTLHCGVKLKVIINIQLRAIHVVPIFLKEFYCEQNLIIGLKRCGVVVLVSVASDANMWQTFRVLAVDQCNQQAHCRLHGKHFAMSAAKPKPCTVENRKSRKVVNCIVGLLLS